jgi:polar amino acid transport system permease protein
MIESDLSQTVSAGRKPPSDAVAEPVPVVRSAPRITLKQALVGSVGFLLVGGVLAGIASAAAMQWSVVGHYLFTGVILSAVRTTIELTVIVQVLAIVLGACLAVIMLGGNSLLAALARGYIWLFRGVPALVQLLFWYNLALLLPSLTVTVPFGGPSLFDIRTNSVMTPMLAAILGLGLHEAGFMCDVIRSGILSVDHGQEEAATALGLSSRQVFWRVILPQSMRVIVPNTGNRTIGTLKFTSLASFVAVPELLYAVQGVYNRTLEVVPLLTVATIWYLVIVTVLTFAQDRLERHYSREASRPSRMSWLRGRGAQVEAVDIARSLPSEDA